MEPFTVYHWGAVDPTTGLFPIETIISEVAKKEGLQFGPESSIELSKWILYIKASQLGPGLYVSRSKTKWKQYAQMHPKFAIQHQLPNNVDINIIKDILNNPNTSTKISRSLKQICDKYSGEDLECHLKDQLIRFIKWPVFEECYSRIRCLKLKYTPTKNFVIYTNDVHKAISAPKCLDIENTRDREIIVRNPKNTIKYKNSHGDWIPWGTE